MIYQQNGNTCWTSKTSDSMWTPLSAFPVSLWFSHGAHFVIKKLSRLWKPSFAKTWCHQKKRGTFLCWSHGQPQNSVEQIGVPWGWKITWGTLMNSLGCPSAPWHTAWQLHIPNSISSWFLLGMKVRVTQSCPTLCDPMDYAIHGILQARILEWVAFPVSSRSSQPSNRAQVSRTGGRFFTSWSPLLGMDD